MYESADAAQRAEQAIPAELDVTEARLQRAKIRQKFSNDLAREYLSDFPELVQLKVFDMAWERGHSERYRGIENEYQDLATLVEAVSREE